MRRTVVYSTLLSMLTKFCMFIELSASAANTSWAQTRARDTTIYHIDQVDNAPRYLCGSEDMMDFVSEYIRHFDTHQTKLGKPRTTYGQAVVSCIIEADGSTRAETLLRATKDAVCDSLALSIVNNLPCWQPARLSGEAVRVRYYYPVTFPPITPQTDIHAD